MSPEERSRLELLDAVLRSENVREQIRPIVERVRVELARKKEAVMTWEPIPLAVFSRKLPAGIRSAWVFFLRALADTGAERHPNSHQRMMSFEGSGDMQTGELGQWQSNALVSDPEAPLERRWISIPPNVWHRPVVGANADWTVVSFHTVAPEELIEERPDSGSKNGTKQMKYLGAEVNSGSTSGTLTSKSVQAELFADSVRKGGLEGEALRCLFAADTAAATAALPLSTLPCVLGARCLDR